MTDWLYGRHAVEEALAGSARTVHEVLIRSGAERTAGDRVARLAEVAGVPVRRAEPAQIDEHVPGRAAVAARCSEFRYRRESEIPEGSGDRLMVVLDGIQDPQNLGAIVRTAEVAGADGVCIQERRSAPVSAAVVRASAGATEHLPIYRVTNVARLLRRMRDRGYWTVGLVPEGPEAWDAVDYRGPIALVVGAEGAGLRRLVASECDHRVALPVRGRVQSLNASAAFAVVTFELLRQRGSRPTDD